MKRQLRQWMLIVLVIGLVGVYPATAQEKADINDVSVSPTSGASGRVVTLSNTNGTNPYPCYADGSYIGTLQPKSYLEYTVYGEDKQTITFECDIYDVEEYHDVVGYFTVDEPPIFVPPPDEPQAAVPLPPELPADPPPDSNPLPENNPVNPVVPVVPPQRQQVQQVVTVPPPTRTPRPPRQPVAMTAPENTVKSFEAQFADLLNKLPDTVCLGALQLEDVCLEKASYPTYGLLCIGLVVIVIIPRLFRRRSAPPPMQPRREANPPPRRDENPQPSSNPCEQQAFQKYARRSTQMGGTCQPGALQCKLERIDPTISPYKVTKLEAIAYERSNGRAANRKILRGSLEDINDILNSDEGDRAVLSRRLAPVAKNVLAEIGDWLCDPGWDYRVTLEAFLEGSGFKAKFALYHCTGTEWQALSNWEAPVNDKRQEPVHKFASLRPEMLQTQPCRDDLVNGFIEFIRQI